MKDCCLIEVKANKILQGKIIAKSTTLLFHNVILLELLSKYLKQKSFPSKYRKYLVLLSNGER